MFCPISRYPGLISEEFEYNLAAKDDDDENKNGTNMISDGNFINEN